MSRRQIVNEGELVGRSVVAVHRNAFADGRGGTTYAPVMFLDDGSQLALEVDEVDAQVGGPTEPYGVRIVRRRPAMAPADKLTGAALDRWRAERLELAQIFVEQVIATLNGKRERCATCKVDVLENKDHGRKLDTLQGTHERLGRVAGSLRAGVKS